MNDAFINIASQITPDSQRVADIDFDDVALYEFVRSKSGNQSFEIPPITEAQMLDLIKKIPSSKAIGCDGLSAKVLKLAASVLVHPLCRLVNFSISTGCFPSTWKTAQVTPLFKRGSDAGGSDAGVSDAGGCYPYPRHVETTRHGQQVLFYEHVFIPGGLGQNTACLGTEETNC